MDVIKNSMDAIQALLLDLPCCLQTGHFTPEELSLGWRCFERLLQIYLRGKYDA